MLVLGLAGIAFRTLLLNVTTSSSSTTAKLTTPPSLPPTLITLPKQNKAEQEQQQQQHTKPSLLFSRQSAVSFLFLLLAGNKTTTAMASAAYQPTTAPTIGMKLDAVLSQVDELSSTQLYGLIVAATVTLCVFLLGTGSNTDVELATTNNKMNTTNDDGLKKPRNSASTSSATRQPRWHIFKWINYLASAAFLSSVGMFCMNASEYLHHESQGVLVQFLVGWSVFLMYFFGFFGISLIHEDIPKDDNEEDGIEQPRNAT